MSPKYISAKERDNHETVDIYDECPVGGMIEGFSNESCKDRLIECDFTEAHYDALEKAIKQLTKKQKFIAEGFLAGKTHQQITSELGLANTSSISIAWHGAGKGGILKKLRKLVEGALKERGVQL